MLYQLSYISLYVTSTLDPSLTFGISPAGSRPQNGSTLERETGIEPATNSLEGCDSTTELLPPELCFEIPRIARDFACGLPLRSRPQTCSSYSRLNLCRPYGTQVKFPLYPGLRFAPSWANCRSTPSGFYSRAPHSTSDNQT